MKRSRRSAPSPPRVPATRKPARNSKHTRGRILQILQLDKENEQLLLRCSLTGSRSPTNPAPSVTMLQKIYSRCA